MLEMKVNLLKVYFEKPDFHERSQVNNIRHFGVLKIGRRKLSDLKVSNEKSSSDCNNPDKRRVLNGRILIIS